jgi:hypothetical protein
MPFIGTERRFSAINEGGFEVVDDFLGEHVGIGKILGLFEAFILELENVALSLHSAMEARLSVNPTFRRIS